MQKTIFKIAVITFVMLAALSCSSVQYFGPTGHVGYRDTDQAKSSSQKSLLGSYGKDLKTTYDEEYTYDDKGNLLKTKLTEYFDYNTKEKRFVVWEIESKILGGKLVPYRVTANGIPFIEIEYELMTVAGDGAVLEKIPERNFSKLVNNFWTGSSYQQMELSQSNFPVSFKEDGKFVREMRNFNFGEGFYYENILTLGFDNIVLKRFHISAEKLTEGIGKSYIGYNYRSAMLQRWAKGMNVDFNYEWKVIANKICETKMTYQSKTLKLVSDQEYNAAGKRTMETWFISDPGNSKKEPVKIFEQTLTY